MNERPTLPETPQTSDKTSRATEMIGWVLLIVSLAVGLGLTWFGPKT